MTCIYKAISWWDDAYHVFHEGKRIGIVNKRELRLQGKYLRDVWMAHNVHFFDVPGQFATRTEAAAAIPRGPIHQPVDAFS